MAKECGVVKSVGPHFSYITPMDGSEDAWVSHANSVGLEPGKKVKYDIIRNKESQKQAENVEIIDNPGSSNNATKQPLPIQELTVPCKHSSPRCYSIFYVPLDFKEKGYENLPLPRNEAPPTDAIALFHSPSQDATGDKTLDFPASATPNLYSFLDATLTWKSQSGDVLVGGEILVIREGKNTVWKNPTLLNAARSTLNEFEDPVVQTSSGHQQKIIFGPPGTGKSYSIKKIQEDLKVNDTHENKGVFRTTFHPEYSYGDFVAKLLPVTVKETVTVDDKNIEKTRVEYQIHAGPFIQTLANALAFQDKHFLLVIDEINRGNCATIFGDIFQLLDRKDDGSSEYEIDSSELTRLALEQELRKLNPDFTAEKRIYIPANFSMIATMNTSDESVFYMDSAFKRRWQFQYIGPDEHLDKDENENENDKFKHADDKDHSEASCNICKQRDASILDENGSATDHTWEKLRKNINAFLLDNSTSVRRIEDKQLGLWFIKAKCGVIAREDIQFKLMHYLWDNVFARDKEPLQTLLGDKDKKMVTFGQFSEKCDDFLAKMCATTSKEPLSQVDEKP